MTIRFEKDYIRASKLAEVKALAKEFKAAYTDGDLLRAFNEATDSNVYGDTLCCDCECFEASGYGSFAEVELAVRVVMFVYGYHAVYRVQFYCDSALNVDVEDKGGFYLWELETFDKR